MNETFQTTGCLLEHLLQVLISNFPQLRDLHQTAAPLSSSSTAKLTTIALHCIALHAACSTEWIAMHCVEFQCKTLHCCMLLLYLSPVQCRADVLECGARVQVADRGYLPQLLAWFLLFPTFPHPQTSQNVHFLTWVVHQNWIIKIKIQNNLNSFLVERDD